MYDLQLEIKAFRAIRIGIGILSIVGGIVYFIYHIQDFRVISIILAIVWIIFGIQHLTNDFGANKIHVKPTEEGLLIRWAGIRRQRIINSEQIENITFNRYYITINRKNERPIMLALRDFEVSQKRMAYNYFSEIAERYNVELIRN